METGKNDFPNGFVEESPTLNIKSYNIGANAGKVIRR